MEVSVHAFLPTDMKTYWKELQLHAFQPRQIYVSAALNLAWQRGLCWSRDLHSRSTRTPGPYRLRSGIILNVLT
jgi:hypothetical protein